MFAFVGIDVAKSSFVACLLLEQHRTERSFSNDDKGLDAFKRWLDKSHAGPLMVTMEATGRYFERIADFALENQWSCFVLNPLRFKYYAQSQSIRGHKTDLVDARLMALYLSIHHEHLHPWQPPSQTKRLLRDLTRRIASVEVLKQMQLNAREALEADHAVYLSVQRMVESIDQELTQLQQALDTLFAQDEQLRDELQRLQQIPGCGPKLARVVLSELGDVNRFGSSKELTAWAGLVPKQHQSGSSVNKKATTHRGGSSYLKRTLYMAAVSAIRSKGWQGWVHRQRKKGKEGKRLVVAMMDKLLRVMWGVLRTKTQFNANHLPALETSQ